MKIRLIDFAEGFHKYSIFPNCLGVIDGKNVIVHKPKMSGSFFYNYKNLFFTVWLGVVDVSYKFINIDIAVFGKKSDSTIFEKNLKIMIKYQKVKPFLVPIRKRLIHLSATRHFHFHQT